MSTPQSPDDGTTPQDPSDPQNPYGAPPPPPNDPTFDPPPPPSAPPSSPPPAGPPPATPIPPATSPYGDPSTPPAAPTAPPPYGEPPPAYAQPLPAYSQPGYPQYGATTPAEPGKGMAVAALIIGFLGCTVIGALVAIPMAIVVLVRSRGGQNHGKGLAISAIVVSILSLAVTVVIGVGLGLYVNSLTDVNDLKAGDCITANGLTDAEADTIDTIKTVACSDKHDGEVLATTAVTADLAKDFSKMDPQTTCGPAIDAAGKTAVLTEDISVTALTVADPHEGDNIACVGYHSDGSKLTGKLG